jgi:site-specific DNA-methyltransferase (adenine-specific)
MDPSLAEQERRTRQANPRVFFEHHNLVLYCDDILTTEFVRPSSVDLIVTSPPYNVGVKYESYGDDIPYDKYLEFSQKWLSKCRTVSKEDGRLCLVIPLDKNKGGQQSVCADLTTIAKRVGWRYHATVIWNEQDVSPTTDWGSWMSAFAPRVISHVKAIVVLYNRTWNKIHRSGSDITLDEFVEWTNGMWNFSGENRTRVKHPTPFPTELPKRCIKLFSYVGDAVMDPFLGSGTSLIACIDTGRAGIGVEVNEKYCQLAANRIRQHVFQRIEARSVVGC